MAKNQAKPGGFRATFRGVACRAVIGTVTPSGVKSDACDDYTERR